DQGGFVTSTEQKLTPYIAYAGEIGGGGYRFEFGFTAGGENVYFENGNPLEIEICDGQAVYFKRHFLNFDEEKAHIRGLTETASALNVIAGDYESIYKMLRDAQHRGNLILKNAEKVCSIAEPQYYYRQRPKSIMNCDSNFKERAVALGEIASQFEKDLLTCDASLIHRRFVSGVSRILL
ncbi:hypothetical protein, partial [Bacteroides acidifaciens]|uniref:hypothetical protein n=1 Tax=Bacteroides acidifaciens TaxID=85831 RepID=UPI0025B367F5